MFQRGAHEIPCALGIVDPTGRPYDASYGGKYNQASFILPSHKKTPTVSVAKRHTLAYSLLVKTFVWNPQKNRQLQRERGVAFEEVVAILCLTGPLAVMEHPNTLKYLGQKIFVVELRGYAHIVPSRETEKEIHLITIIPSRKATRDFLGTEESP